MGQGQVFNKTKARTTSTLRVAIPLGQGQVLNEFVVAAQSAFYVAIPLGQGQVFNTTKHGQKTEKRSQSLWVRDRFLMMYLN